MIYLDNGATSLPKPQTVVDAVSDAMRHCASPGRGSSHASRRAEDILYQLRLEAGDMFHCPEERVILTTSATHGLNIAIKSLVSRGDRVVVSGMEHNAVMRPLTAIGAQIVVASGPLFDDASLMAAFQEKLTPDTRLCILSHVSNVFGWIQPLEAVAKLCHSRNIPLIVDAAQSAGVLPLDMESLRAAFIAMPGHKGLMGPMGTGLLLCGLDPAPLLEGGTGSLSRELTMPEALPDRLEPGTHNIPGAAGLLQGLRWIRSQGMDRIRVREAAMAHMAGELIETIPGIRVFSSDNKTGVLSFLPERADCVLLAESLAAGWGIALRAGLHCAPTAHQTAGTLETGTIRISPGPFTTEKHIRTLFRALKQSPKM